jgi:hypothetical protein
VPTRRKVFMADMSFGPSTLVLFLVRFVSGFGGLQLAVACAQTRAGPAVGKVATASSGNVAATPAVAKHGAPTVRIRLNHRLAHVTWATVRLTSSGRGASLEAERHCLRHAETHPFLGVLGAIRCTILVDSAVTCALASWIASELRTTIDAKHDAAIRTTEHF